MAANNDFLSNFLGLTPQPRVTATDITPVPEDTSAIDADYEFSRANIKKIVTMSTEAFEDFIEIAKSSQSARAVEVVAQLMEQIINADDKLMDVAKKKKEVSGMSGLSNQSGKITNSNIFVGSTAELQKLMKSAAEEEKKPEDDGK